MYIILMDIIAWKMSTLTYIDLAVSAEVVFLAIAVVNSVARASILADLPARRACKNGCGE